MAEIAAMTGPAQPAQPTGAQDSPAGDLGRDFQAFVEPAGAGLNRLDLLVEGVHCGGCVRRIEGALAKLPQVTAARVNLSTRRLNVTWDGAPDLARNLVAAVEDLGFTAGPTCAGRSKAATGRPNPSCFGPWRWRASPRPT
jgi:copper chaperone CopZ